MYGRVHVTDPAPASQPGCSQSSQPTRVVTAVALTSPQRGPGLSPCRRGPWAASSWTRFQRSPTRPRCCRPRHMGWSISSPRMGRPLRASFGGRREASGGQSGARAAGERGDSATFYLSMGQPSTYIHKQLTTAVRRSTEPKTAKQCGRPRRRSATPPSPPIRQRARSHSRRLLLHHCR